MFDHISKHLEVRQKYSAARHILNSIFIFQSSTGQLSSRCLEMWSNTVFRVWYITSKTYKNILLIVQEFLRIALHIPTAHASLAKPMKTRTWLGLNGGKIGPSYLFVGIVAYAI